MVVFDHYGMNFSQWKVNIGDLEHIRVCWAVRRRFPSLCWSESALDTSQEQLNFRDQGAIRRSEAQREPLTPRGIPIITSMKPHGR